MIDYGVIRAMAKERPGARVSDMLALARQNDPFYIGTESQRAAARWFREMWDRLGYTEGVHLRRMHYALVSLDPPVSMLISGSGEQVEVLREGHILTVPSADIRPSDVVWPYVNTERAWGFLNKASKYARYLRLVSPRDIVDRRNPDAQIYARYDDDPTPRVEVRVRPWLEQFPTLPEELPELPALGFFPGWPGYQVGGYAGNRQYHVELWSSPVTMSDVLEPICRRHGVNLALATGEFSITRVIEFLDRLLAAGVPGRILYVSDYDPADYGMSISVARKIEFLLANEPTYSGMDVRLEPIMLTSEQVERYGLPRVPAKDAAAPETGRAELDALEALHPGEMARIVEEAILRYRDDSLAQRSLYARAGLVAHMAAIREGVLETYESDMEAFSWWYGKVRSRYDLLRARFSEAASAFHDEYLALRNELGTIQEDARPLAQQIADDLEKHGDALLAEYPLPQPELPDAPEQVLFDSSRSYLEQLAFYKTRREEGAD